MLDSTRLRAELFFVHRSLKRAAIERCPSMLDDLRSEAEGTTSALIWQSLYADCLRIAYSAAILDGVISNPVLVGIRDLLVLASQYYSSSQSTRGLRNPLDPSAAHAYLSQYAFDAGPFGRGAALPWRGLALCKRVADAGESEPLERYARLIKWMTDTACQLSGVSPGDPRWQRRLPEIAELRQTLVRAGYGPEHLPDSRIQAFLNRTRIFDPIQQAASVFEPDPFDVEDLHAEARSRFRNLVDQAIANRDGSNSGRTLLVMGGSGAGKTHLLRSFRSYVQDYGRGFVAYAPMISHADDYPRYLLDCLVTSLSKSYAGEHTGLQELASGLGRLNGSACATRIEQLSGLLGESKAKLDDAVNSIVGDLLGHPDLKLVGPDLLRVLLYSLCPDHSLVPRVNQYLRCGDLNDLDRRALGNVVPHTGHDAPSAMIRSLARLAFITRRATMVLMVDQAELSGLDSERAVATFRSTIETLLGIASDVRSVVVVIACLSNLYEKASKVIGGSTLDRLEKDPPPVQLLHNRTYEEVRAIVGVRLAWLFASAGAEYKPSEPTYPIPEALLRDLANRQPREILDQCQVYRDRCLAQGKMLPFPDQALPTVPPVKSLPLDQIASLWRATCDAVDLKRHVSDDELLTLVAAAGDAYALEIGAAASVTASRKDSHLRLHFAAGQRAYALAIAVTNGAPPGGVFGAQIAGLKKASNHATAVALRTSAFPSGTKSVEAIEDLGERGGRAIRLDKAALRVLLADQLFAPAFAPEHIAAWRRRDRPIASDPTLASLFEHEPSGTEAPAAPTVAVEVPNIAPPPPARKRAMSRPRAMS